MNLDRYGLSITASIIVILVVVAGAAAAVMAYGASKGGPSTTPQSPTGVGALSTSATTTSSSVQITSTSYTTVTADTTLSFTSTTSQGLHINYVVVTRSNCGDVYHFDLNATERSSPFGDGPPFHYVWNFGDGSGIDTNSSSTDHTYTSTGNFLIGLTVYSTSMTPTTPSSMASESFVLVVRSSTC